MIEAREILQRKERAKQKIANEIKLRVLNQMKLLLIKETFSEIIGKRIFKELEYVRTVKEVCIQILIGEVFDEARLVSKSKVLKFAKSITQYRYE